MKTVEEWKQAANRLVNKHGFFPVGYEEPREIGSIVEISLNPVLQPVIGKALLIGPSNYEEFLALWMSQGFTCALVLPTGNFYRAIVD